MFYNIFIISIILAHIISLILQTAKARFIASNESESSFGVLENIYVRPLVTHHELRSGDDEFGYYINIDRLSDGSYKISGWYGLWGWQEFSPIYVSDNARRTVVVGSTSGRHRTFVALDFVNMQYWAWFQRKASTWSHSKQPLPELDIPE